MPEKSNYRYIDFFMKPSLDEPLVYYMTEHQEEDGKKLFLLYKPFRKFLFGNFVINHKDLILNELDSHNFVHLDGQTGEFEVISLYEDAFNADFKTLLDLNQEVKEVNMSGKVKEKVYKALRGWKSPHTDHVFSNPHTSKRRF